MRALILLVLLTIGAPSHAAQAEKPENAGKPRRDPELQSLVDEAGRCAPEIEADAIVRLSPAIIRAEPAWARELLERAFVRATAAEIDVRVGVWRGIPSDSDEGMLMSATQYGLDRLSLRCRVVERMLDLDAKRALDLFRQIEIDLAGEPTRCETALVPDLRTYYTALGHVVSRAFTERQKRRGDDVAFLSPYLANLRSPLEAGPAILMLSELELDRAKYAIAVRALKVGLEGSAPDRSAFRWVEGGERLAAAFSKLRQGCRNDRALDRDLVWAFRKFVVKNLSAARCVDSRYPVSTRPFESVAAFNKSVPEQQAIRDEEIVPSRIVEFRIDRSHWWSKEPSAGVMLSVQRLNENEATEQPFTEAEKQDEVYRRLYTDAVLRIEGWASTDEDRDDVYFQKKCITYAALASRAPSATQRDEALAKYLLFIGVSPLSRSKPAQWLLSLRYLLADFSEGDGRDTLLAMMLESREPAVRLYARLAERGEALWQMQ